MRLTDYVDNIHGLAITRGTNQEVVGFNVSIDKRLLVNGLYAGYL